MKILFFLDKFNKEISNIYDRCMNLSIIQDQDNKNEKWLIPQGCGVDKLFSILTGIRNKNGDNEFVEEEKIKKSIDLSDPLITSGFGFLKSIKLIEKQQKEIKLTKIGAEFTEAFIREDENISKIILQIIKGSYLIDLFDYLNNNKDLKVSKVFTFIKSQAKLSNSTDGRLFSDLAFQGVKAIIGLFQKAELLTETQIQDFKNYKNSTKKKDSKPITKKKETKKDRTKIKAVLSNKPELIQGSKGIISLSSGIDIQLTSKKNVELAISQLNDLIKEFQNIENNNEGDSTD